MIKPSGHFIKHFFSLRIPNKTVNANPLVSLPLFLIRDTLRKKHNRVMTIQMTY